MTYEQAEKKVKKLWGETAFAYQDQSGCWVGELNGPIRLFYGNGKDWDAAFKMAKLNIN